MEILFKRKVSIINIRKRHSKIFDVKGREIFAGVLENALEII
jgi:hypothetical protein